MPKKDLGQYFTQSELLQEFVFKNVKNFGCPLLEPSFGRGDLLVKFLARDPQYPMVCCEIDETVQPLTTFGPNQKVLWGDFLKLNFETKFATIIGNPPYVKQKSGNLYLKFIDRCVELLTDSGELIFIVPSDFLKLTGAAKIITKMVTLGSFTDFLFPHDEKLFDGASIDVVVFRYQKGLRTDRVTLNGTETTYRVASGIVTFGTDEGQDLGEAFDVYVGLVSGKDDVFKVPFGTMDVLTDKNRIEKFIYKIETPEIREHMDRHKAQLMARKIRKFSEHNWWEWGAPRNIQHMESHRGKPCIYVRTMTRSKEVAFLGTVQYFGGGLLCLVPKEPTTDLGRVIEFLNKIETRKDYTYAGRFKIGHKQVSHIKLSMGHSAN
jgi:adenine-specific DNA-methyltransferase